MGFSRRSPRRGFAVQTLMFFLATISITATATVAIYEAYLKWYVEPRKPTEISRLTKERDELTQKNKELDRKQHELEERLWQQELLDIAEMIHGPIVVPIGARGDERALIRLRDALDIIQRAIDSNDYVLAFKVDSERVESLKTALPSYRSALKQQTDAMFQKIENEPGRRRLRAIIEREGRADDRDKVK